MSGWGIDLAYRRWTLADYGLPGQIDWEDIPGFFLGGVTGSYKSSVAAALIRDRIDPDHPQTLAVRQNRCVGSNDTGKFVYRDYWEYPKSFVRWMSALGLCSYMRQGWDEKGGTSRKAAGLVRNCRIVVIDDVGTEIGTDNQTAVNAQLLGEALDKLLHNGVGLIVTSNLARSDMDTRIGSRLCDLEEIVLPQIDHRARRARERKKIVARPHEIKG